MKKNYREGTPKLKHCTGPECLAIEPKGLTKRYTEFEPSASSPDGLAAFCEECSKFIVNNPAAAKLAMARHKKENKATQPEPKIEKKVIEKPERERPKEEEEEKPIPPPPEPDPEVEAPPPRIEEQPQVDRRVKCCKGERCKDRGPQPLANFNHTHLTNDGYTSRCRQCILEERAAKGGIVKRFTKGAQIKQLEARIRELEGLLEAKPKGVQIDQSRIELTIYRLAKEAYPEMPVGQVVGMIEVFFKAMGGV